MSEPERKSEDARRAELGATSRSPARGTSAGRYQDLALHQADSPEDDREPEDDRGEDRAREEQSLDPVLDRVEGHEGEDQHQDEEQQGAQQRMPELPVE